ncbi:MAG: trypsin-like peptidase domain-containing protein [Firmicutes bacterium]|nr:trypsin-like peptidase domain-containing protein [Bacillota bacterium]
MKYFTYSGYKQGPNLGVYVIVALVGAIIGGLLVLTVAPGYIASRAGLPQPGHADSGSAGDGGLPSSLLLEWSGDWPVPAVAEKVGPSVVGIISQTTYYDWFYGKRIAESGGSGVVFKREGAYSYIATNQHVVADAQRLYVVVSGGRRLDAELVGEDWQTDLAVIRVKDESLPVAVLGDSDLLRPGELVMAIGNPLDMEFERSVTVGVVSGLNRKVRYSDEREFSLIQTDAAINPGNSGGPLVNMRGEVVGINNMKIATENVEGMGFAIPVNLARRVLDDLVAYGRVIRPYLGVKVLDADDASRYLGRTITQGLYVAGVVAGSPAAKAGIRQGDIIAKVAGEPVASLGDLRRVLDRHRPGDKVTVEIIRSGVTLQVEAVLAEAPQSGR